MSDDSHIRIMAVSKRQDPCSSATGGFGRLRRIALLVGLAAISMASFGVAPGTAQTINGTLMEVDSDQPISLGLIIMMTESGDSVTSTVTDGRGEFTISSDEPGSFLLVASAFGFKETAAGVFELGEGASMDIEFRIAAAPMPIDGLLVSLQRPVLEHNLVRNGFVRRVSRGLGVFLTPYNIENSPARTTADLFRGIPGVHVTNPGSGLTGQGDFVRMVSQNDYCAPTIYLDGSRLSPAMTTDMSLNDIVPRQTVDAVEIYRRPAEIPIEYGMTGGGGGSGPCGVLVIWTKTR